MRSGRPGTDHALARKAALDRERVAFARSRPTRHWRYPGPVHDVLGKPPFAEFVTRCRVRWKRPLPDNCRRFLAVRTTRLLGVGACAPALCAGGVWL